MNNSQNGLHPFEPSNDELPSRPDIHFAIDRRKFFQLFGGGLAVALALQEPLTNLFAGIQIIASGKIKTGDYVQLNTGEEGFVEDIAWRSTSIKALANQIIIVPNNKLANAIVRNYMTPDPENGILVNLGVAYHSDLDKVETVTVDVATQIMKEVEGGIPDFKPFIRYNNF